MVVTSEGVACKISTVLVVDDMLNVRRAFRALASERRVLHARSNAEALRTLESESVGMAVVDLWMPGGNGLELLLQINERFPHVSVIMMSGMWCMPAILIASRARAFYCVDKQEPTWLEDISSLVEMREAGLTPTLDPASITLPTIDEVRGAYALGILEVCGGNVSATADVMDVQRSSLQRMLKAFREQRAMRQGAGRERLRAKLEQVSLGKKREAE